MLDNELCNSETILDCERNEDTTLGKKIALRLKDSVRVSGNLTNLISVTKMVPREKLQAESKRSETFQFRKFVKVHRQSAGE
ncbi:unnamed protein product [Heterotrigona itama]|uniref:Uncharacterized protein n=1 Tax=Heterotrigona itama TaxID=395501 RepID=A0A6V7HEQ8_9HYME|nr:unnamed protein product [Heterotrigona itama]